MVTKRLKSIYTQSIKQQANSSLARSDWLVTRFVEDNTKKIPDVVKTYRKKGKRYIKYNNNKNSGNKNIK